MRRIAWRNASALILAGIWLVVTQPALAKKPAAGAAADPFAAFVAEALRRFAIPREWISAVIKAESFGDVYAVSAKGAMGLMQIMPDTWADLRTRYRLGDDPFDPHDNILAGTGLLRQLHDRYGDEGFLAAYNAGPARYEACVATGRKLPEETRAYVAAVARSIIGNQRDVAPAIAGGGIPSAADPADDCATTPQLSRPAIDLMAVAPRSAILRRPIGTAGNAMIGAVSDLYAQSAARKMLDALFQPFVIRGRMLTNRVVMSPMSRYMSPGGVAGADVAAYYRRRAEGGAGLIITEGTGIPHAVAVDHPGVPHMHGKAALAGWQAVADAVHAAGGLIWPQLWHQGVMWNVESAGSRVGEALRPLGIWGPPDGLISLRPEQRERALTETRPMRDEDIQDVIDAFAISARNAKASTPSEPNSAYDSNRIVSWSSAAAPNLAASAVLTDSV